ncbi:MAG: ParA family protein [Lachnospiraceae bacterium]|nr:ParA family protein [Lachnospiraceae bacterium]
MKVIAIANQKGGVGKTTTTWEIGSCLAAEHKRVLVIDLDQQANLSDYVDADPKKATIYDLLKADNAVEDALQHLDEFDFIAASEKLSKADKEFSAPEDIYLLKSLLEFVENDYDYVLVDSNPARNTLLNMCYIASDYILIPTECDAGSITGIDAIYGDLMKYRKLKWSNAEVLGLILNKYEKTSMHTLAIETLEEKASEMGSNPFILTVRKSIKASESKLALQSMQKYNKYGNPAMDYRKVAAEIIERTQEA